MAKATGSTKTLAPKRTTQKGTAKQTSRKGVSTRTLKNKAKGKGRAQASKGKSASNGAPSDRQGLTKSQAIILQVICKSKKPLTRQQIAEAAGCPGTSVSLAAGYDKQEINEREVHQNSLLNLGLVKMEDYEGQPMVFSATAKGRGVAAKIGK